MNTFSLKVIASDKVFFDGKCGIIIVPALDGEQAMGLVRFRKGYATQDIQRTQVQQQFLKALAKQCLSVSSLTKIGVCRHFCRICHHEPHNRQYGLVRQGAAGLRF